jgi:hypothetical protein
VKLALADKAATSGTGHSVSSAASIVDDFINWAGRFNNGYHILPRLKSLTGMRVYTGQMIRSLVFSLLAVLCSVGDLFEAEQQTAMINVLTRQLLLMRKTNLRLWDENVPRTLAMLFEQMEEHWDSAVGKYKGAGWQRVKIHLPHHWEDLHWDFGTPVHWSTMHFIEALQRILKAAWNRTNGVDPSTQIMKRIELGRYVCGVLLPSIGVIEGPIDALAEDTSRGAYLLGFIDRKPGTNTLYANSITHSDQPKKVWNRSLTTAMNDYITEWTPDSLPTGHILTDKRIVPRARVFLSRKGICAVRVPVMPNGMADDGGSELAIFSMFNSAAAPPPGGVAAVAATDDTGKESSSDRFLVHFFFSYDIRGLSSINPNAPVPDKELSNAQVNDAEFAIDLAMGQMMELHEDVAAASNTEATLSREIAQAIFQRVKPTGKLVVVEVGQLCQPLWAFPWLESFDAAKSFFRSKANKWDANEWLVSSKLY